MTKKTKTEVKAKVGEVVKKKRVVDLERSRGFLMAPKFTDAQLTIIRKKYAKGLTDDELGLFVYRCRAYGLDPLKGEVSVRIYNASNLERREMAVIVQRDGYLTIAHSSGNFNGMQSGVRIDEEGKLVGWAKVWNKSAEHPIELEVYEDEYNTHKQLWETKPRTMLQKVAESQALRRAFNISGVYEPSEVASWSGRDLGEPKKIEVADGDRPVTEVQLATIKAMGGDADKKMTRQEAVDLIVSLKEGGKK